MSSVLTTLAVSVAARERRRPPLDWADETSDRLSQCDNERKERFGWPLRCVVDFTAVLSGSVQKCKKFRAT